MVAGMETTTFTVSQATRLLAQHPEWLQALWEEQERLIEEFGPSIDRRVRRPGLHLKADCGRISNDTCMSMPYMHGVHVLRWACRARHLRTSNMV